MNTSIKMFVVVCLSFFITAPSYPGYQAQPSKSGLETGTIAFAARNHEKSFDRFAAFTADIDYQHHSDNYFINMEFLALVNMVNDEQLTGRQKESLIWVPRNNFHIGFSLLDWMEILAGTFNPESIGELSGRMLPGPGIQLILEKNSHTLQVIPFHFEVSGITDATRSEFVLARQTQRRFNEIESDSKRTAHSLIYHYTEERFRFLLYHNTTFWEEDRLNVSSDFVPERNELHSTTIAFGFKYNSFHWDAGARVQSGSFSTTEKKDEDVYRVPVRATTGFTSIGYNNQLWFVSLFYYFPEPSTLQTGSSISTSEKQGSIHTGLSMIRTPLLAGHYDAFASSTICSGIDTDCIGVRNQNELPELRRPSIFVELETGIQTEYLNLSLIFSYLRPQARLKENNGNFFSSGPDLSAGDFLEAGLILQKTTGPIHFSVTYSRLHLRETPAHSRTLDAQTLGFSMTYSMDLLEE